jgi:hypothetical protein
MDMQIPFSSLAVRDPGHGGGRATAQGSTGVTGAAPGCEVVEETPGPLVLMSRRVSTSFTTE